MEHHTIAALQLAIGFAALMAGLSILPKPPRWIAGRAQNRKRRTFTTY